ncbi:MAG: HyaD/HybD family hydrogenase maturation endopeptidase [Rhodospirillaceae bacterium]
MTGPGTAGIDAMPPILVLGIGNLVCGDEGFGVRAVTELGRRYRLSPRVRLMDGGTQGLYLVPYVTACTHLLVFDAIDYGLPPGTLRQLEGDEVPRHLASGKISVHQTGFQEVLAAATLLGALPAALVVIGVQPWSIESFERDLSPPVAARLGDALALAGLVLARWGAAPEAADREA